MKAIKKSLCFALAVLSAAFTARAADPVAVWSGFNELESGNFAADIGSLVPDAKTGAVTLGSSGIKFANSGDAWSGANKGWTVAIKYSTFTSGTAAALVSLQQNSETSAAGIDKIGAWVNANGKVQGLWQAGSYGTANGTLPASGVFFVRYKDSNGTSVHMQNGTLLYEVGGLRSSNNNWGKSFAVGSFANGTSNVAAGLTVEAVAIFDSRVSDADMAAYAFPDPIPAEYETVVLTNDDGSGSLGGVGSYRPDALLIPDSSGIEAGKIVKVKSVTFVLDSSSAASADSISINGEQSSSKTISGTWPNTSYPLVTYSYGEGVEVEIGKSAPMVASGDSRWRLFANVTDPDRRYIGVTHTDTMNRGFRPAYKIVVKVPVAQEAYTGKVINFNIQNTGSDGSVSGKGAQTTLIGSMPETSWNNNGSTKMGTISSGIKIYNTNDGTTENTSMSVGVGNYLPDCGNYAYYGDGGTGTTGNLSNDYYYLHTFQTYRNYGNPDSGIQQSNVKLVGVPFDKYDVIVYFNGSYKDGSNEKFHKVNITCNGASGDYTVDTNGVFVAGTEDWGATRQVSSAYGVNAAIFSNVTTADFELKLAEKYANIAAFQIVEKTGGAKKSTAEIDDNSTWANLRWDIVPTASSKAELTVSANAILTFDETTAFKSLKLIGSADLTIDGLASSNIGLIQKINVSSFTGKLRFEIDASAGLSADATLRNYIRTASDKVTFVFKSTVLNKGAALDYGVSVNAAIHSHIIFDGGTHTMKYGYGGSGSDGNLFGVNGTGANPTLLVTGNATLNFTAKDISYWSGASDIGGVIRVNDGATLNLLQNGSDTFFYRQRLWLDPGSFTTFNFSAKDQGAGTESCFRFHGGAVQNKEQIYVPASAADMTSKPAVIRQLGAGSLHLASDATRGLAIFVGAKSKLRLETPITAGANDATIIKYGAGVFETTSSITVHPFTFTEGTFASSSTINKLTIGQNVALDISNGAPTITDVFTAQSKQLNLTIAEPTHMMDVITLPAAADKAGWAAVVNGNTGNPCELIAEGNTLKLKWKIPPTITVEADDVTIEVADDWNGGVVTVGLDSLNVGDYEGDIRYLLRFGDKVVVGSVKDMSASFELGASEFTAGNIYRGTFELEYGEGNSAIVAAEVTVYAGEKTYGMQKGWINETTKTFASTGSYDPEQGATFDDSFIKFSNPTDVVFTPTNSPADYVAKCDSTVTFEIFSGEEAIQDDDDTVAADLQAGVKIVDDGSGGVKFQFISGDEWIDGPAAALNTTYEVKISFHYAKEEGDTDSVTYAVKDLPQGPVVAERRANTAEKLEAIAFADGTQIASLTGTCQIEVADPVEKETGLAPGADGKELKATDETAAKTEAKKIPVVVPSEVEGGLTEGLDDAAAEEAKAKYKENFMVVAQKNASGKFVAIVVPTADAETNAVKEVQRVSKGVLTEVTALTGDQTEGTATISEAVPGFFYGVAEDGAVVNMKTARPKKDEWKMAGASGKVELKVTKPANAKARFYKIVCSPLPPSEE